MMNNSTIFRRRFKMAEYNFQNIIYLDDESNDIEVRYTLGTGGKNPLIVFGVNPSTATPSKLDPTVKKVDQLAKKYDFNGWIMLNVYSKRDTKFADLPNYVNTEWEEKNIKYIIEQIKSVNNPTILVSFGGLILDKEFLPKLFCDIYDEINSITSVKWLVVDPKYPDGKYKLLTTKGMPRHLMPRKNFTVEQAELVDANDLIPEIISKLRKKSCIG
jgi:hypothetical protein